MRELHPDGFITREDVAVPYDEQSGVKMSQSIVNDMGLITLDPGASGTITREDYYRRLGLPVPTRGEQVASST